MDNYMSTYTFNILTTSAVVIITALVLFYISYWFDSDSDKTCKDCKSKLEYNTGDTLDKPVIDDCILILTRSGCIYCDKLEEFIELNNKAIKLNLIIVKVKEDSSYEFNNNYTDLSVPDRDKIKDITHAAVNHENIAFPMLFKNSYVQKGMPSGEKLTDFFEISD